MCSGRTSNEVKYEYQQGRAGQGSCLGSLQSAVNFLGLKALNQIFKSNSKINIKVEWLWNRLDSFVICFCTWPCTKFISIPIILKLLKNRNIALVYSVIIWEQKTKDCALHCHQGTFKINCCFNFDVCAAFITSLLYWLWSDWKLKCVLQWNLDLTKGIATGNTVRYNEISLCLGSVFFIYCIITRARNVLRYTEGFFIKRFVKLSGSHCTCELSESSYQFMLTYLWFFFTCDF